MRDFVPVRKFGEEELPLPSVEVDASLRASGEGARIVLNAGAVTRAGGASSTDGRGKQQSDCGLQLAQCKASDRLDLWTSVSTHRRAPASRSPSPIFFSCIRAT